MTVGLLSGTVSADDEKKQRLVPERFYISEPTLAKATQPLATRCEVVIIAIGGASTMGSASGELELAWPARLGSALTEKFPSARIKIVNVAMGRQTAKRGPERLDRDVSP